MIRTFLIIRPAENSLEPLVGYYRDKDVIGAAVPYGLELGELAHPSEGADTLAVVSLWPSQHAYDSWLEAPERANLIDGMLTLLDGADAITGWSQETEDTADADFAVLFGNRPVTVRIRTTA